MSTRTRVAPGGSMLPATKIGPDGKFARKDLHAGVNRRESRRVAPGGGQWDQLQKTGSIINGADAGDDEEPTGASIFDPVLCELAYRWFCPPGGLVLDPFAGGSVRGVVANKLGRRYIGIELRAEQVSANRLQGIDICEEPRPDWRVGDARDLARIVGKQKADFVFTCPPYADLEVYSDDPRDLSTMRYSDFLQAYRQIIGAAIERLAADRFAAIVVGDVRDRAGFYRRFVSDTEAAFENAGARLYNEAILITAVGSLPVRVGRQFESARKLGKTHQNVLVFCKGDPRRATAAVGPVESGLTDLDAPQ